jgi:hypothetical protein
MADNDRGSAASFLFFAASAAAEILQEAQKKVDSKRGKGAARRAAQLFIFNHNNRV